MADFKVIETQEQLDALIGDRIARAEKKAQENAAKEYADYADLKKKVETYEAQLADYGKKLTEATETAKGHTAEVEELRAKIKNYETATVKARIAHEVGLPYELANRLTGDNEEAIRQDAETMAKFISKPAAPMRSTEQPIGDSKTEAYRALANSIGKN